MLLVNGEYQEAIPATDRGIQYGDGLFETVEIRAGRPVFLKQHIDRLVAACLRLHIPAPSLELLRTEIALLLSKQAVSSPGKSHVLKIIVTRGSGGRGYQQPSNIEPTRLLSLHPYPDYPIPYQQCGITARFCQTRLGLSPALAGLKHLNRLEQVLARAEWQTPTIQEGIMLDVNGHVIEGTMSNVFFVKHGRLHTPNLSLSGVAGIIRAIVIQLARQHNINVVENNYNVETLLSAEEIFVTNSIIGIWPLKHLETTPFKIGALTQQLQTWLDQFKKDEKL